MKNDKELFTKISHKRMKEYYKNKSLPAWFRIHLYIIKNLDNQKPEIVRELKFKNWKTLYNELEIPKRSFFRGLNILKSKNYHEIDSQKCIIKRVPNVATLQEDRVPDLATTECQMWQHDDAKCGNIAININKGGINNLYKKEVSKKENSHSLFPLDIFSGTNFEQISLTSLTNIFSKKDERYIERTFLLMRLEDERGNINNSEHALNRLKYAVKHNIIDEEPNILKLNDYIALLEKKAKELKEAEFIKQESIRNMYQAYYHLETAGEIFSSLPEEDRNAVTDAVIDKAKNDYGGIESAEQYIAFNRDIFTPIFKRMDEELDLINKGRNDEFLQKKIATFQLYAKTVYNMCLKQQKERIAL